MSALLQDLAEVLQLEADLHSVGSLQPEASPAQRALDARPLVRPLGAAAVAPPNTPPIGSAVSETHQSVSSGRPLEKSAGVEAHSGDPLSSAVPSSWTFDPRWSRRGVNEEATAWGAGLRAYSSGRRAPSRPRRATSHSPEAERAFERSAPAPATASLVLPRPLGMVPASRRGRSPEQAWRTARTAHSLSSSAAAALPPSRKPWSAVVEGAGLRPAKVHKPEATRANTSQVAAPGDGDANARVGAAPPHASISTVDPELREGSGTLTSCAPASMPSARTVPLAPDASAVVVAQPAPGDLPRAHLVHDPLVAVLLRAAEPASVREVICDTSARPPASQGNASSGTRQLALFAASANDDGVNEVLAAQRELTVGWIADVPVGSSPGLCNNSSSGQRVDRLSTRAAELGEALRSSLAAYLTARPRTLAAVRTLHQQCIAEHDAVTNDAEVWLRQRTLQLIAAGVRLCAYACRPEQQQSLDSEYRAVLLGEVVRKGRVRVAFLRWHSNAAAASSLLQLLRVRDAVLAYRAAQVLLIRERLEQANDSVAERSAERFYQTLKLRKLGVAVRRWVQVAARRVSLRARGRSLADAKRGWSLDSAWRATYAGLCADRAATLLDSAASELRNVALSARCFGAMVLLARRLRAIRIGTLSAAASHAPSLPSDVAELPEETPLFASAAVAALDADVSALVEKPAPTSALLAELRGLRERYGESRSVVSGPALTASRVQEAAAQALQRLQPQLAPEEVAVSLSVCQARSSEHLRRLADAYARQCVRNARSGASFSRAFSVARRLVQRAAVLLCSSHPMYACPASPAASWSRVMCEAVAADSASRARSLRRKAQPRTEAMAAEGSVDESRILAAYGRSGSNASSAKGELSPQSISLAIFELSSWRSIDTDIVRPGHLPPVARPQNDSDIILAAAELAVSRKRCSAVRRATLSTWLRAVFLHRVDSAMQLAWRRKRAQGAFLALVAHAESCATEIVSARSALERTFRARLFFSWGAAAALAAAQREKRAATHWASVSLRKALRGLQRWAGNRQHRKRRIAVMQARCSTRALHRATLCWRQRCATGRPLRRAALAAHVAVELRLLASAWSSWRQRFPARVLLRRVFSAALRAREHPPGGSQERSRYVATVECVRAWRDAARQRRDALHARHLEFTAAAHARTAAIAKSFATWLGNHRTARSGALVRERRRLLEMRGALRRWAGATTDLRDAGDLALATVQRGLLRRCLTAWESLVRERLHVRSRTLLSALARWRLSAAALSRQRNASRLQSARIHARVLLRRWVEGSRLYRRRFEADLALRAAAARGTMTAALLAWQHAWIVRRYERARESFSVVRDRSAHLPGLNGSGSVAGSPASAATARPGGPLAPPWAAISPEALPVQRAASTSAARRAVASPTAFASGLSPLSRPSALRSALGSSSPTLEDALFPLPTMVSAKDGSTASRAEPRAITSATDAVTPRSYAAANVPPQKDVAAPVAAPLVVPASAVSPAAMSTCVDLAKSLMERASEAVAARSTPEGTRKAALHDPSSSLLSAAACVEGSPSARSDVTSEESQGRRLHELKARVFRAVLGGDSSPMAVAPAASTAAAAETRAVAAGSLTGAADSLGGLIPLSLSFVSGSGQPPLPRQLLQRLQGLRGPPPVTPVAAPRSSQALDFRTPPPTAASASSAGGWWSGGGRGVSGSGGSSALYSPAAPSLAVSTPSPSSSVANRSGSSDAAPPPPASRRTPVLPFRGKAPAAASLRFLQGQ